MNKYQKTAQRVTKSMIKALEELNNELLLLLIEETEKEVTIKKLMSVLTKPSDDDLPDIVYDILTFLPINTILTLNKKTSKYFIKYLRENYFCFYYPFDIYNSKKDKFMNAESNIDKFTKVITFYGIGDDYLEELIDKPLTHLVINFEDCEERESNRRLYIERYTTECLTLNSLPNTLASLVLNDYYASASYLTELPSSLESLSFTGSCDISDYQELFLNLPKNLKKLSFYFNYFECGKNEKIWIMMNLPKSLTSLEIFDYYPELLEYIPKQLTELSLEVKTITESLIKKLPKNLVVFKLRGFEEFNVEYLSIIPKTIKLLELNPLLGILDNESKILSSAPETMIVNIKYD